MAHNDGIHRFTVWLSNCSVDQKTAILCALRGIIDVIEDEITRHGSNSSSNPAELPAQNIELSSPSNLPTEHAARSQERNHSSFGVHHSEASSGPGNETKRYQRSLTLARLEGRSSSDLESDKTRIRSWWLQRVVHGDSSVGKGCHYAAPTAARNAGPSSDVSDSRKRQPREDRHDSTFTAQEPQYKTTAAFHAQDFLTHALPERSVIQHVSEPRVEELEAQRSNAFSQSVSLSNLPYEMLARHSLEELSQDQQEQMSLLHEWHMPTQEPPCHPSPGSSGDMKGKKRIRHRLSYSLEGGHLHLYKKWSEKLVRKFNVKRHR